MSKFHTAFAYLHQALSDVLPFEERAVEIYLPDAAFSAVEREIQENNRLFPVQAGSDEMTYFGFKIYRQVKNPRLVGGDD